MAILPLGQGILHFALPARDGTKTYRPPVPAVEATPRRIWYAEQRTADWRRLTVHEAEVVLTSLVRQVSSGICAASGRLAEAEIDYAGIFPALITFSITSPNVSTSSNVVYTFGVMRRP